MYELSVSAFVPGPLRFEGGPWWCVEQILVNLLTNAAKYSDGAGHIGAGRKGRGSRYPDHGPRRGGIGIPAGKCGPAYLPCVHPG